MAGALIILAVALLWLRNVRRRSAMVEYPTPTYAATRRPARLHISPQMAALLAAMREGEQRRADRARRRDRFWNEQLYCRVGKGD